MSARRRVLWPAALGGLAALLVYCSAHPEVPPRAPSPLAQRSIEPVASGALPAPAAAPEPISLETLTPLMAGEGFEDVLLAIENGEPERALRALDEALARKPPPRAASVEYAFVRARLREQSGNVAAALADFELSRQRAWPLAPDATLGVARAELAAGRAARALEILEQVTGSRRLSLAKLLVRADAAFALGDRARGLSSLRSYLAEKAEPQEAASVTLRLSSELLSPREGEPSREEVLEGLALARRLARQSAKQRDVEQRALALIERALALLPEPVRAQSRTESPEERLERLRALVESRRFEEAEDVSDALLLELGPARRFEALGCEVQLLRGKAIAGRREWGRSVDTLGDVVRRCERDAALHARALFLAGRHAASDKRHAQAVKFFSELEAKHATNSLADDARLYAALSYLAMGVEARFTELLQTMPEHYSGGDMVVEGVFRLALRRMDKGDWSGAARLLDRAVKVLGDGDAARGQEHAGRERYFLARAELVLGRRERSLSLFEEIVRRFPLSYYMLLAHTRLLELEPVRARELLGDTIAAGASEPFQIATRPEFASPGFVRALALLRVGETSAAVSELDDLGLSGPNVAPELVWGVSLAYARARAFRLSHELPRRRLTDWLTRWPSGSWELAWQLSFPRPWSDLVEREAKKNEVERALVYAVMREESAFDPDAVSIANAYGLMQLIVPTAKHVSKGTGLPYDRHALRRPEVNIALGARTLGQLERRFKENPLLAIPGYNAGPGNARAWLADRPSADFDLWVELIPFRETRRYMKRVLASRATYAFLYEGRESASALSLPLKIKR